MKFPGVWQEIIALLAIAAGLGLLGTGFLGLFIPEITAWQDAKSPFSPGGSLVLDEERNYAALLGGVGLMVGGLVVLFLAAYCLDRLPVRVLLRQLP